MHSIGTPLLWVVFFSLVAVMLAIDLFLVGGGKKHKVSLKEAGIWSLVWVTVSMLFAAGLWWYLLGSAGSEVANSTVLEFITGYLLEKALAVDNVFVWLMIFSYFAIPAELQKRVLIYGVLGAIVLRAIMIFAGAWLVEEFHWILYLFGAFLLFTGAKMWFTDEEESSMKENVLLGWLRKRMRVTEELDDERFFVKQEQGGKLVLFATPLFLVLVLVELSDIVFAVDSIPAIFAITTDPFIVLTSNILAILGLRAMYFLLSGMADRFELLKYGLALVLVFIGAKMLLMDLVKIPVGVSLAVVALLLIGSVVLSLRKTSHLMR
jgi:tellurite resistance protein TerC